MKIEVSSYYRSKGVVAVYVAVNKDPRRVATLRYSDKTLKSMSYAKYLYTSYYACDVDRYYDVDHINGDKMDDRIENLQIISASYNRSKDHKKKNMVVLKCPVCKCEFLFEERNLPFRKNPCCSFRCGRIKAHR